MPKVPLQLDSQLAHLHRPNVPDSVRVAFLVNISQLYINTSIDSARAYGEQAVALARRSHYTWGQAFALGNLAAANFYASDYPAAQRNFEAALAAARHEANARLVGNAYLGLGNVAWELGNRDASHRYYEQARQSYASATPRFVPGELLVLHNSANNYLAQQRPNLARPLLAQAQALLTQQPKSALPADQTDNIAARLLIMRGQVQQLQHQPDSAAATWRQAVALGRAKHLTEVQATATRHLAEQALAQRRWAPALEYAQQAAALHRAIGDPSQLASTLQTQAAALAAMRRPGAYDTLLRAATLRDTLLNQERLEAVATAQARFDRAGQEARIAGLEKDQRIQALEAERRTTRTRLLATAGTAGGLLLLAGVVLVYRRRQRRRETALRTRLAADLHDDLGPLLTQLAVETSLLRENEHSPEQLLGRLQRLTDTSQLATRHLGELLRDLDQGPAAAAPAPLGELVQQLRDQAHEALAPHELSLTFRLAEAGLTERMVAPATRHALSLIFREALHNVVKHAAGASLVRANLSPEGGGLLLTLLDDGQAPPVAAERPGGRGLRNMRTRAEALGGRLEAGPAAEGYQVQAWLPG